MWSCWPLASWEGPECCAPVLGLLPAGVLGFLGGCAPGTGVHPPCCPACRCWVAERHRDHAGCHTEALGDRRVQGGCGLNPVPPDPDVAVLGDGKLLGFNEVIRALASIYSQQGPTGHSEHWASPVPAEVSWMCEWDMGGGGGRVPASLRGPAAHLWVCLCGYLPEPPWLGPESDLLLVSAFQPALETSGQGQLGWGQQVCGHPTACRARGTIHTGDLSPD